MKELFISATRLLPAIALAAMASLGASDAAAGWPDGYYDSLEGKCGVELMRAVKAVAQNHKKITYGSDTWKAFEHTDVKVVDGTEYWWDMYSNELVPVSAGRPDSNVMNIEHSVANSWWGKTKNDAYCDIVHLNPSNSQANSKKGNYPLAELQSVTWNNGVTFIGSPKPGQCGGAGNCYEPADQYKGDFARVFMYMFTIYDNISWKSNTAWMYDINSELMFRQWARELLLRWSQNDPVSDKERSRNDGIQSQQRNRNPFIDLPDLAEHIWGSKSTVPFSLEGGGGSPEDPKDPEATEITYSWLSSTATDMAGWTVENIELAHEVKDVWKWREYNGNHYLNGSAFISGTPYAALAYAWSPEVDLTKAEIARFSFSHAAKFQTTLRSLCKVAVKDAESGDIDEIDIPAWPNEGSWTFVPSGDIDLAAYAGRKVHVGFKYESDETGADTWEINEARLYVKNKVTGIECIPSVDTDSDDSFLVEVWGNNILAPEGAVIFDINGRQVSGTNLQHGVYIVVKPTFRKSVKIVIAQ